MFSKDRILTLDVGASKITLCEFARKGGAPELLRCATAPLDAAADAAPPLATLGPTLKDMMRDAGIRPAPLYVLLAGQQVFPRFVKIPAASGEMLGQLVAAEASEGLPFPLDQVVWDYQTLGNGPSGDLDVLIAAAKSDTSMDAAALAAGTGVPLELVDAAPLALYNAVRAARPADAGCTLVLDAGAKTTNLVFVEGGKVFMRTIPVAGNSVTAELARGLGADPAEAEEYKKQTGFVALGGTYGVPDDETADRASKLIRNVATRLHSEVNRSINFYRSQQGGSAPDRVLLCGGSALLRHLDTFFREKLGVEVELFNPLAAIPTAPDLALDDATVLSLAPSVGLARRACGKCPVEINLIPPGLAEDRRFRRRLPFFAIAVLGAVLALAAVSVRENAVADAFGSNAGFAKSRSKTLRDFKEKIARTQAETEEKLSSLDYLASVAASRNGYAEVLDAVRAAMLPDTMVQSLSFENADGRNGAPRMSLVVRGFTDELNALAGEVGGQSAGEMFLSNLLKSPLFKEEAGRDLRSQVLRQTPLADNPHVMEIPLVVYLSRPVGVFSPAWSAPAGEPAADAASETEDEE